MASLLRKKLLLLGLTGTLAAGCATQGTATQETSAGEAAQPAAAETATPCRARQQPCRRIPANSRRQPWPK